MNKWVPVLAGGLFVLVSFQNCSPESSSQNQDTLTPQQSKIEDPDVKQASLIQIHTMDDSIELNLDLSNGNLIQRNRVTNQTVNRCLSSSMIGTINDLLQSSQLCESTATVQDSDRMCAQVYTPAYASLLWSNGTLQSIGESLNSCERGPDLCGQDGAILRGLLRDIVARWDEWSCDFQAL